MASAVKPTQAELKTRFSYDEKTGLLITKDHGSGVGFRRSGKVAGHKRKDGYIHVQIGRKSYYAHCIIWCWMTGEWPTTDIDHRDTDRANNRWINLRISTKSQNAFARVSKNPNRGIEVLPNGKFRAKIGIDRKKLHLGCFAQKEDAIAAFRNRAKEAFGEFAEKI